jgi:hypothetical protein
VNYDIVERIAFTDFLSATNYRCVNQGAPLFLELASQDLIGAESISTTSYLPLNSSINAFMPRDDTAIATHHDGQVAFAGQFRAAQNRLCGLRKMCRCACIQNDLEISFPQVSDQRSERVGDPRVSGLAYQSDCAECGSHGRHAIGS